METRGAVLVSRALFLAVTAPQFALDAHTDSPIVEASLSGSREGMPLHRARAALYWRPPAQNPPRFPKAKTKSQSIAYT